MSAYVVDRDTIHILVAAGAEIVCQSAFVSDEHASQLGQTLLDECVASVRYRYPNDDIGELPGSYDVDTIPGTDQEIRVAQWLIPYVYEPSAEPLDREAAAEAIRCYEYQSCEHPGWPESWARSYCLGLRANLDRLPKPPEPEREPEPDPEELRMLYGDLSRDETIKRIRAALKRRSGKAWSVTGGRGTGWGWIHISAPPKRCVGWGYMTDEDQRELGELLGKDGPAHHQGETIPSGGDYYREYIDRAEGRAPTKHGVPYWD